MRVALTGHRPQRLGLPEDELDIKWAKIGHWIMNQILDVSDVYCGMANGSDILIGLNACVIKESYRNKIYEIPLVEVLEEKKIC